MQPTLAATLDAAAATLQGLDGGRVDAEILLAHLLGWSRSRLLAYPDAPLDAATAGRLADLVARRAAGVPVAYLTGVREFWSLTLRVTPAVLVPRPETELLVELVLAAVAGRPSPTVLDLGTGSGAIGLALAAERPDATVWLTDASAAAAAVARRNADGQGLGNVTVGVGSWYEPLPRDLAFDAIASNPPYLAATDPYLTAGGLGHEPRAALVAGASGLEALGAVIAGATGRLRPDGLLVVEHGSTQGPAVRGLFAAAGLHAVATHRDLAGHERATAGRRPG